jgi:hypothetical protein
MGMRSPLGVVLFAFATLFAIGLATSVGLRQMQTDPRARQQLRLAAIRARARQHAGDAAAPPAGDPRLEETLRGRSAQIDSLRSDLRDVERSVERARTDARRDAALRGRASRLTMDAVEIVRTGEDDPMAVKMSDVVAWENEVARYFLDEVGDPALAAKWAACPPVSELVPGQRDTDIAVPYVRMLARLRWFRRLLTEIR